MSNMSNGSLILTSDLDAAGRGLEAAIRARLSNLIAKVDELQRRQLALLSTVDGVLDPAASSRLEEVRTTMAKVPKYSRVCHEIQQSMATCDERVASLTARAARLRAQVVQATPFEEICPSTAGYAYRVHYRGGINVRTAPSLESLPTGEVLRCGAVVRASERRSPLTGTGDVFVCLLPLGRGWVIESFAADRKFTPSPSQASGTKAMVSTSKLESDSSGSISHSTNSASSKNVGVVERVVLERISELAYGQALERAAAKAEAQAHKRKEDEAAAASAAGAAAPATTENITLLPQPGVGSLLDLVEGAGIGEEEIEA